jgi:hypothetical protein
MLHHIGVLPVRFVYDHPELSVRASRIVGYRMVCTCGERGKVRGSFSGARVDLREHRAATDDGEGVAPLDT